MTLLPGALQREPSVSSFLSLSLLSPVGLHHLWAQPSAPCDLLHSGKKMEVIHSGNCDCLFPGRGCSCEVPASFPQGSRAHCLSRPRVSRVGSDRATEKSGAPGRLSGSALHLSPPPGAPELCGSPPSALCYSPTSCLWLPTRAHFPGREAAEGREFLGDTPTESRLLPPPYQLPLPTPTSPGNPRGTGAAGSGSLQRASRLDRRVATGH